MSRMSLVSMDGDEGFVAEGHNINMEAQT